MYNIPCAEKEDFVSNVFFLAVKTPNLASVGKGACFHHPRMHFFAAKFTSEFERLPFLDDSPALAEKRDSKNVAFLKEAFTYPWYKHVFTDCVTWHVISCKLVTSSLVALQTVLGAW